MAAADGPTPIQVDDADLSITYSGGWYPGGNPAPGTEFDGTTHGATANGSRLAFTFNGTSVAVYGTIPGAPTTPPSTSLFMVDNDFANAANVTPPQPAETVYQHMWWSSGELSPGTHMLNVIAQNVQEGDLVWIDFVQYVPLPPEASVSSSATGLVLASVSTPSSSSTASSSTIVGLPSSEAGSAAAPTASGAPTLGASTQKHARLGAILPAVIVPMVLIVFVIGAYILWSRRRRTEPYQGSRESILGRASASLDRPHETAVVAQYATASAPASFLHPASTPHLMSTPQSGYNWYCPDRATAGQPLPGDVQAVHRYFLAYGAAQSKESIVLSYAGDVTTPGVVRYTRPVTEGEVSPPAYVR